jgi:hypothetical protein
MTCKTLWEKVSVPKLNLLELLISAASEDSVPLISYFLPVWPQVRKGIPKNHILHASLRCDSWKTLKWCITNKTKFSNYEVACSIGMISLKMLDFCLEKIKEKYDEYWIQRALECDRDDIFRERWVEFGMPVCDDMIKIIAAKNSEKCFRVYAQNFPPQDRVISTMLTCGSELFTNQMIYNLTRTKKINMRFLNSIISNPNHNDEKFYECLTRKGRITESGFLQIIKTKTSNIVEIVLAEREVVEEHITAAFESIRYSSDWAKTLELLFSKFEGLYDMAEPIVYYCCLDIDLIASKLRSVKCLSNAIFFYRNVELFRRLAREVRVDYSHLKKICNNYSDEMLEEYIRHARIPARHHASLYKKLGPKFVTVLERNGQFVSSSIRN